MKCQSTHMSIKYSYFFNLKFYKERVQNNEGKVKSAACASKKSTYFAKPIDF